MEKKKISLKEIGMPKLIILFIVGVILILLWIPDLFGAKKNDNDKIPKQNSTILQNDTNMTSNDTNTYITSMEKKLESKLRKVSGIGDVEVMLTLKASKEQVTLKDSPYTEESLNEDDGEGGSRANSNIRREESTVLLTGEDGKTEPYIIQELEPEVEGVLVIAEGGDNPDIISDIVDMAEVLFNVPAHKVKVMKLSYGTKSSGG